MLINNDVDDDTKFHAVHINIIINITARNKILSWDVKMAMQLFVDSQRLVKQHEVVITRFPSKSKTIKFLNDLV